MNGGNSSQENIVGALKEQGLIDYLLPLGTGCRRRFYFLLCLPAEFQLKPAYLGS
jgi:hypothetical protein